MSYPRKEYGQQTPKKQWTPQEAKLKIAAFCAYQERCQEEVRKKLAERGVYGTAAEDLIATLIAEGFLNEERYAKAFVRGKFRLKKWGRNKIIHELKFRKISPTCINSGLKEIEGEEYWNLLLEVAGKKWQSLKEKDPLKKKYQTKQYLMGRGFEQDLIQMVMKEIISE
ncbi:regulatory protein RecX [Cecembia calidifontis]|jgi:regulatory protein|nr:regulatory protein RecX [Cecembia calidifontis]